MGTWYDITRDPDYQTLSEGARSNLKQEFFNRTIAKDPEFGALSEDAKKATYLNFFNLPDDTGQGQLSSMVGSAARGFGEVVPGAIQGLGALTGISPLETAGESIRSGIESVAPVNPLYADSIPVKGAGVVGQIGSVLGTGGIGGLAGKALGAERIAAGATAAEQALATTNAITKGANAALYGSAGLQGAASGAQLADQYGLEGGARYANILAGSLGEMGTELLPFGTFAETGAVKKLLTGAPVAGRAIGAPVSEFFEEGTNQLWQNAALKALAPEGANTPGLTEGVMESAAYGGLGGGILAGVNVATGAYKQPEIAAAADLVHSAATTSEEAPLTTAAAEQSVQAAATVTSANDLARYMPPQELQSGLTEAPQPDLSADAFAGLQPQIQNEPAITAPVGGAIPAVGQEAAAAIQPEQQLPDGLGVLEDAQLAANEPASSEGVARNAEVIRQAAARLAGTEQGPNLNFSPVQPTAADERKYTVANVKTGKVVSRPDEPMTHKEAVTFRSKFSQPNNFTLVDVTNEQPISAQGTAPTGIATQTGQPMSGNSGKALKRFSDDLEMSGFAKLDGSDFKIKAGSDGTFYVERTTNGNRESISIGHPDIESARNAAIQFVSNPQSGNAEGVASNQPNEDVGQERGKSNKAGAESSGQPVENTGMSLEEAKKYLNRPGQILGFDEKSFLNSQRKTGTISPAPTQEPPSSPAAKLEKEGVVPASSSETEVGGRSNTPVATKQTPDAEVSSGKDAYSYEMRARPPGIGTHPKEGFVSHTEGGKRHGFITYNRPLTEKEIYDYELKPVPTDSVEGLAIEGSRTPVSRGGAKSISSTTDKRGERLASTSESDNRANGAVAEKPKKGDLVTVSLGGREYPKTRILNVTNTPEGVRYQVDVFGPKFVAESSIVAIEKPVIKTATKVAATPQLIRQLGDIAVKNQQPVDQGYIDAIGGSIPQGYVKQGDSYVFQPKTQSPSDQVTAESIESKALEILLQKRPNLSATVAAKAKKYFASRNSKDLEGVSTGLKTAINHSPQEADPQELYAQLAKDRADEARARKMEEDDRRADEEMAKRQAELSSKRSTAWDSVVGTPNGVEMNAVSEADGQESLALVHNSGDVPGVLNAFVGTSSQFLANPENETNFPDLWKILSAGRVDEGNFAYGRAFVFTDGIGVNASDRRNAERLGVTPAVAAVRRVLIHESLVHRGIYGLPANLQMQVLQWVRQNTTPEQLDNLARDYPQYENWRNNPQQMLGLCEEYLAKTVEKITKFPKDGPLSKLFDLMRDIWRWITGETGEPTVQNLRDVIKLLKAGVVAADARLVNDGKIDIKESRPAFASPINAELARAAERFRQMNERQAVATPEGLKGLFNPNAQGSGTTNKLFEQQAKNPVLIYRAGDESEVGVRPWASFTPDEATAKSYTDNPGFGGSHIRKLRVDAGNILDLTDGNAFRKLADALGMDSETAQEWRDNGWNYPWEESSKIKRALTDSDFDAIKYTDDFPSGATSIVFTREPRFIFPIITPQQIRSEIRAAYDRAIQGSGSVQASIQQVFDEAKTQIPTLTEKQFGEQLQALYEDGSAFLVPADRSDTMMAAGEKWGVYDASGMPGSYVGVMPSEVKASVARRPNINIPNEIKEQARILGKEGDMALNRHRALKALQEAQPKFHIKQDAEAIVAVAINIVDALKSAGVTPQELNGLLTDPEFLDDLGIPIDSSLYQAVAMEMYRSQQDEVSRLEKEGKTAAANKLRQYVSAMQKQWYESGTRGGKRQNVRLQLINNPRYQGLFLATHLNESMREAAQAKVEAQTDIKAEDIEGADQKSTDAANKQTADEFANLEMDELYRLGEEQLDAEEKSLWGRIKDYIADLAAIAMANLEAAKKNIRASNVAMSASDRVKKFIAMSQEDRDNTAAEIHKKLKADMKKFMGKGTETKKKTKQTLVDGEIDILENPGKEPRAKRAPKAETAEQKAKLEKAKKDKANATAARLIYRTEELFRQGFKNDIRSGQDKPSIYKEFIQQIQEPTDLDSFAARLAKLKVSREVAERMFRTAALEKTDREAVRNERNRIRLQELREKQAMQLVYLTEQNLRQSGIKGIQDRTASENDSVRKAFKDQINAGKEDAELAKPLTEEEFVKRLAALKVRPEVAKIMFKTAERERADIEASDKFDLLESPRALRNMMRKLAELRMADKTPFLKPISWKKLFSLSKGTQEQRRAEMEAAIRADESLQNLSEEDQKKLADLIESAWNSQREKVFKTEIDRLTRLKKTSDKAKKAITDSTDKLLEMINQGVLDNDELYALVAEKFGFKPLTQEQKAEIEDIAQKLQGDLPPYRRTQLVSKFKDIITKTADVPFAQKAADWWVTAVLTGPRTAFTIGLGFLSGGYQVLSNAIVTVARHSGDINAWKVAGAAINDWVASMPRNARNALGYLWDGREDRLDPTMSNISSWLNLDKKSLTQTDTASVLLNSKNPISRLAGGFMTFFKRLLVALDMFNAASAKDGSLAMSYYQTRQSQDAPFSLKELSSLRDFKAARDYVLGTEFGGVEPTNPVQKSLLDAWASQYMWQQIAKFEGIVENATYNAQQGAMSLDPSGLGGHLYHAILKTQANQKELSESFMQSSKKALLRADGITEKSVAYNRMLLAYIWHFAAYNMLGAVGLKFARYAGNRLNQTISFVPGLGAFRLHETEGVPREMHRSQIIANQAVGSLVTIIALALMKEMADEPDEEKRGWGWEGSWDTLTPERKSQRMSAGKQAYTFTLGGKTFKYNNFPMGGVLAAVGSLMDMIQYSPDKWNERTIPGKVASAGLAALLSVGDSASLSQFSEMFGRSVQTRDPLDAVGNTLSKTAANYAGGFIPRIFKDVDKMFVNPEINRYKTPFEFMAREVPIYRSSVGKPMLDIFAKPVAPAAGPTSREFIEQPTEPEYRQIGRLNERGIWLTSANPENRLVGKGSKKRHMTDEEGLRYIKSTGNAYREFVLRNTDKILSMTPERGKQFVLDKADEIRDRAAKLSIKRS